MVHTTYITTNNKCTEDPNLTFHTGLDKPGIMRHAGSGPEVQRFQQLIDSGGEIKLKGVEDVNTVASLLKNFLRQLPDPLLTAALYKEWVGLPGKTICTKIGANKCCFRAERCGAMRPES